MTPPVALMQVAAVAQDRRSAGHFTWTAAAHRRGRLSTRHFDTVSGGHVDLGKGVVSSLYNPFAAVPSMHVGYALIVGASLARDASHLVLRLAGLAYPLFVLFVIVATGDHFLVDAAAGAAVVSVAFLAARSLTEPSTDTEGKQ